MTFRGPVSLSSPLLSQLVRQVWVWVWVWGNCRPLLPTWSHASCAQCPQLWDELQSPGRVRHFVEGGVAVKPPLLLWPQCPPTPGCCLFPSGSS